MILIVLMENFLYLTSNCWALFLLKSPIASKLIQSDLSISGFLIHLETFENCDNEQYEYSFLAGFPTTYFGRQYSNLTV